MIFLFALSLAAPLAVFLFYPLVLSLLPARVVAAPSSQGQPPTVSVVVVHREAGDLLNEKIANCLLLSYPPDRLQCVYYADGPCRYPENLPTAGTEGIQLILSGSEEFLGKNEALNRAVALATNEILVLSDVDALLAPDALTHLVGHFVEPDVGGVCGRRHIRTDDRTAMHHGQQGYIGLDSQIKRLESRQGFLTSNDGKLYAVRRHLFPVLPAGVTDDLFACLAVAAAGYRFLFENRAAAFIRSPSRSVVHEWRRRRRIVGCSLRGILLYRRLCNPLRHGIFAMGLIVNKVMRRLLFPFLVLLLFSSYRLHDMHPIFLICYLGQMVPYTLALLYPLTVQGIALPAPVGRGAQWSCYFLVGNLASFAGVIDFLKGRTVTGWRPEKG